MQKKTADKIQLFTIKTLQKVSTEGTHLNIIKTIYMTNLQPTSYLVMNSWKHSFKIRNKTRMPTRMSPLATFIQYSFEVLASAIREEKGRTGIHIGKEVKRSLSAADMTVHTEDPKDAARRLPALLNAPADVTGCKLTHRSLWHFYTLATEDQKEKLKTQFHLPLYQKE